MAKHFLVFVLCSYFIGCVPPPQKEIYYEDNITNYAIGIIQKASIGDQLIRVAHGKFASTKVFQSLVTDTIPYKNRYVEKKLLIITKSDKFEVINEFASNLYLKSTKPDKSMLTFSISKEGKLLNIYDDYVNLSLEKNIDNIMFGETEPIIKLMINSFSYELILTEISNDYIKATYREYTGEGLIKDAFSLPVTFNITNTNIINFKSLVIEIKNKLNNQIEYVVLKD